MTIRHRQRMFVLASVGAMAGVVIAAACSFPEPTVVPDEGGTGTDGTTTDTSSGGTEGGNDGGGNADVVEPDSAPPIDATSEKPPVEAGCVCDCDEDGFIAANATGCDAGGKQPDCDDLDKRAFPDAGFRKDLPTNDTKGDWNCDGITNREVKSVFVKCSSLSTALPNACDGAEGFVGDPGCGVEGTYVVCESKGLPASCVEKSNTVRTQGCK